MIQSKWPFSHRDLDSGILIYHQTEFHLVVVLIHLWLRLCSIIAPRHLHTSLNARLIVFYFILIPSVDSLFFLSSSEDIRASASLNKAQTAFIAHMHFHYMVFIRLQRAGDQKEQRGLDVQGTRPGTSLWLRHHDQNTKGGLICICCIKTFLLLLFEKQGFRTNHPASIERLHFHQMQCKRVERSSELMDDLIMGDWLYRFRWSYPHCLSDHWSWRRIQSLTGWNHHIQEIQITLI